MDAQTGFTVWELSPSGNQRVALAKATSGALPFEWQIAQVVDEERRRVERHEYLPGDEDILTGK